MTFKSNRVIAVCYDLKFALVYRKNIAQIDSDITWKFLCKAHTSPDKKPSNYNNFKRMELCNKTDFLPMQSIFGQVA